MLKERPYIMTHEKQEKLNPLSASVRNNITVVRISGTVYQINTSKSPEQAETTKAIGILRKALNKGVFSDLSKDEPEDK